MPTPIAHGVAALAGVIAPGWLSTRRAFWLGVGVVVLANLPDADYLPGLLLGTPRSYHRGPTHSLLATLLVGTLVALAAARLRRPVQRAFLIACVAYGSHIVLDIIMPDTYGAAGVPLFWPLSSAMVSTPIPLPFALRSFIDLSLGNETRTFMASLLTWRAMAVFLVEGLLFMPLLAVAVWVGRTRKNG
jgi:inner membrane protein